MKKILINGGAGYIGSYVNKLLASRGYSTVVLDDLSRGNKAAVVVGEFIKGDFGDKELLGRLFSSYDFQAVFHFAALTDVGESIFHPERYYQNNVIKTLNLLSAMAEYEVEYFIFSSSAAIFGAPRQEKISEEHPCHPINAYGHTKLIVEMILRDFERGHGIKSTSLRYFNAAGADPGGHIKWQVRKENNLIPLLLNALQDSKQKITLFGTDYPTPDGTCIRDYIHIHDLATAHIQAMERLFETKSSSAYNLGNSQGYSVKEVIAAVEKITNKKVPVILGERRAGDPPMLVADPRKAIQELNWKLQYRSIEEMIGHAWQSMQS